MSKEKAIKIPESVKTPIVDDEVKSQLPEPKGWKIYGQEFRLINDDTVEAVVDDPTGVVRA